MCVPRVLVGDSSHVVFADELLPPSLRDSAVAPHVHDRDIVPGLNVRSAGRRVGEERWSRVASFH